MKAYLILYNLVCAVGWGMVLYQTVMSVLQGKTAAQTWEVVGQTLLFVQSLAALEVVHSAIKLVKSPVATTFIQVLSRYVVLWCYTYLFTQAQTHWSLFLMVGSWSLVEVPRYLFYATNLVTKNVPFPLFWLRYTLFAILYPTGISGELLQIFQCLPVMHTKGLFAAWYATLFVVSLYFPGSPIMFFHMVAQRKKVFKARLAPIPTGPPPSKGVDFPFDKQSNARSTTIVNQGAIAAASGAVDKAAGDAAAKVKNWRFGYSKHIVKNVELCCKSNAACLKVAETGLKYLHDHFEFNLDGKTMSVTEAMESIKGSFETYTIKGTGKRPDDFQFCVPYQKFTNNPKNDITQLKGDALLKQLDVWCKQGVIERDARDGIAAMVKKPEFHSTHLKDKYFVLLGAGSAMGPLRVLLELGANVIAVDIDRDFVWKRLVKMARDSPGTMILPLKCPASAIKSDEDLYANAGADLLSQCPQIASWINDQVPGKQLVIGGYAYLDSALFVRLAIAMDAIMNKVLKTRKNAALGFLCSPTDVFVMPKECYESMQAHYKNQTLWQKLLKMVVPKNMLVKNAQHVAKGDNGEEFYIVDGLAVAQGPNYALAKRLQHWRCMLARAAGHTVSTNIAPSTATASVVHNPQFGAAYKGMGWFKPLEIVYQDLSNAVMTALLLRDVCDENADANPKKDLGNQIRLFSSGSCHFGIWRMAFKCGSIGEVSAAIGYCKIYSAYLQGMGLFCVAAVAFLAQMGAPHTWF